MQLLAQAELVDEGTVALDVLGLEVIEDVAAGAPAEVKVCKVNVDSETELAERFGIMSIPTLVVMKNGAVKNRSIGVTGKQAIMDMLE